MRLIVKSDIMLELDAIWGVPGHNTHFVFSREDLPEPFSYIEISNATHNRAYITIDGQLFRIEPGKTEILGIKPDTVSVINSFRGNNLFLSNFYDTPIRTTDNVCYKCAEAAFQAQKCPAEKMKFVQLDGKNAKAMGRKVQLRSDWDAVKDGAMYRVLEQKFAPGTQLAEKLMDTSPAYLIEGNTWHDNYWGACMCDKCKAENKRGLNKLGSLLMDIRSKLLDGTMAEVL